MQKLLSGTATVALIAATLTGAGVANASQQIGTAQIWGGGDPSGSFYSTVATNYADNIGPSLWLDFAWSGPSAGTLQNLAECEADPADICLGEGPLVAKYLAENPDSDMSVLVEFPGVQECTYVIAHPQHAAWGFAEFIAKAHRARIVTGPEGSGSRENLRTISALLAQKMNPRIEGVADAAASADNALAIAEAVLADGSGRTFGAFTQRPTPDEGVFAFIEENDLVFLPVWVEAFKRFGYQGSNLTVATGFAGASATKVPGACGNMVLFGTASNEDSAEIAKLAASDLLPEEKGGGWLGGIMSLTGIEPLDQSTLDGLTASVESNLAKIGIEN